MGVEEIVLPAIISEALANTAALAPAVAEGVAAAAPEIGATVGTAGAGLGGAAAAGAFGGGSGAATGTSALEAVGAAAAADQAAQIGMGLFGPKPPSPIGFPQLATGAQPAQPAANTPLPFTGTSETSPKNIAPRSAQALTGAQRSPGLSGGVDWYELSKMYRGGM